MRLKTLNGAPLCEQLDFSESSLLGVEKCNAFQATLCRAAPSDDTTTVVKWRCLTTKDTRLRTGWSQPYLPRGGLHGAESDLSLSVPNAEQTVTFLEGDTTNLDTTVTLDEQAFEADGFLQHSLIFHDTLLSSQVLQDTSADNTTSFLTTSFATTTTSGFSSPSRVDGHTLILQIPSTMATTSLESLPSAHHLRSIYPQTPTPNLLCVLMTSPERREVVVRKGGYKMDLWEISVADDTRSGFKVSFWVRPPQESNNEQTDTQSLLLRTLERVKVGDILLLRNIALTSFRDTAYGQSLNPAITRARTTIDVLMKSSGASVGQLGGLPATVAETFIRVKRWARTHVAADSVGSRKRTGSSPKRNEYAKRAFASAVDDESLPPDTLEAA